MHQAVSVCRSKARWNGCWCWLNWQMLWNTCNRLWYEPVLVGAMFTAPKCSVFCNCMKISQDAVHWHKLWSSANNELLLVLSMYCSRPKIQTTCHPQHLFHRMTRNYIHCFYHTYFDSRRRSLGKWPLGSPKNILKEDMPAHSLERSLELLHIDGAVWCCSSIS